LDFGVDPAEMSGQRFGVGVEEETQDAEEKRLNAGGKASGAGDMRWNGEEKRLNGRRK